MTEITTPIITDETGKKIIEAIKNNPTVNQQLSTLENKKQEILNDIDLALKKYVDTKYNELSERIAALEQNNANDELNTST